MKKTFTNAKETLLVSLYFTTVFSLSCYLTYLTSWNFGVFFFSIIMATLIIVAKKIDKKVAEHVRR